MAGALRSSRKSWEPIHEIKPMLPKATAKQPYQPDLGTRDVLHGASLCSFLSVLEPLILLFQNNLLPILTLQIVLSFANPSSQPAHDNKQIRAANYEHASGSPSQLTCPPCSPRRCRRSRPPRRASRAWPGAPGACPRSAKAPGASPRPARPPASPAA